MSDNSSSNEIYLNTFAIISFEEGNEQNSIRYERVFNSNKERTKKQPLNDIDFEKPENNNDDSSTKRFWIVRDKETRRLKEDFIKFHFR